MLRLRLLQPRQQHHHLVARGAAAATTAFLCNMRRSHVSISGDDDDAAQQQQQSTRTATAQQEMQHVGGDKTDAHIFDNTAEVIEANKALLMQRRFEEEEKLMMQPPKHPQELQPAFVKLRKGAALVHFKVETADDLMQQQSTVPLPPPAEHPWIENQPIGELGEILHGDGQLGVAGTGEVGFDNERREYPKDWRGLQPRFLQGMRLPKSRGIVNEDVVVKYSLERTGRGLFATKDIKKGDMVMLVRSTAVSLGYVSRIERLVHMMVRILRQVHESNNVDELEYLHTWILQGQQTSMVEWWALEHTERVIDKIGGREVLDDLQMHPLHIPRMAAVIDMNNFVVEGYYNEDRGKGYWPEAGLFNHSCCPNAEYEVLDEESFKISDFNAKFVAARESYERAQKAAEDAEFRAEQQQQQQQPLQPQMQSAAAPLKKKHNTVKTAFADDVEEEEQQQEANVAAKTRDMTTIEEPLDDDEDDAPNTGDYLFVCRAGRDIPAGEEILISYVPPEWRYESRQQILHERYKFWCRCEKCAPRVEQMSRMYPRWMLAGFVVFLLLQSWAYMLQDQAVQGHLNSDAGMMWPLSFFWSVKDEQVPNYDPSSSAFYPRQETPASLRESK